MRKPTFTRKSWYKITGIKWKDFERQALFDNGYILFDGKYTIEDFARMKVKGQEDSFEDGWYSINGRKMENSEGIYVLEFFLKSQFQQNKKEWCDQYGHIFVRYEDGKNWFFSWVPINQQKAKFYLDKMMHDLDYSYEQKNAMLRQAKERIISRKDTLQKLKEHTETGYLKIEQEEKKFLENGGI